MKTEREGKDFGIKCWKKGLSVQETLEKAAIECGLDSLPENPSHWPKFLHGAEDAWQDNNLAYLDEQAGFSGIKDKHVKKK